jgi:hypothetical protein
MKLAITAAVWGLVIAAIPSASSQDQTPQLSQIKHLVVFPVGGIRPVRVSGLNIQRGLEYPSVVELKGNVEIRTRVCVMQSKAATNRGALVCDGETVLRADEAVFHEDTGTIEAQGKVTVVTVPYSR